MGGMATAVAWLGRDPGRGPGRGLCRGALLAPARPASSPGAAGLASIKLFRRTWGLVEVAPGGFSSLVPVRGVTAELEQRWEQEERRRGAAGGTQPSATPSSPRWGAPNLFFAGFPSQLGTGQRRLRLWAPSWASASRASPRESGLGGEMREF